MRNFNYQLPKLTRLENQQANIFLPRKKKKRLIKRAFNKFLKNIFPTIAIKNIQVRILKLKKKT